MKCKRCGKQLAGVAHTIKETEHYRFKVPVKFLSYTCGSCGWKKGVIVS